MSHSSVRSSWNPSPRQCSSLFAPKAFPWFPHFKASLSRAGEGNVKAEFRGSKGALALHGFLLTPPLAVSKAGPVGPHNGRTVGRVLPLSPPKTSRGNRLGVCPLPPAPLSPLLISASFKPPAPLLSSLFSSYPFFSVCFGGSGCFSRVALNPARTAVCDVFPFLGA